MASFTAPNLPPSGLNAPKAQKGAIMASNFEQDCRAFAQEFPTANVQRAIALCEAGALSWEDVYGVFKMSLGTALAEVA